MIPRDTGISFSNYKSFSDASHHIDQIRPVNVIIGRNNSGKSALIDVVHFLCKPSNAQGEGFNLQKYGHWGNLPDVAITSSVTNQAVAASFPENLSHDIIVGSHRQFGETLIGKRIAVNIDMTGNLSYASSNEPIPADYSHKLVNALGNPFSTKQFHRILADRDVKTEHGGASYNPVVRPDGYGITSLIQHAVNDAGGPESLVSNDMLTALNTIVDGDGLFTRIDAKRVDGGNDNWEIYIQETGQESVPLSSSGSGLKTIFIVLTHLLLVPDAEGRSLSDYVFAFEEVENNLHPGIQRRLFQFMRDRAVEFGATLFLTTHSSVVIDLFSGDPEAQLIHVQRDRTTASIRPLTEHLDRANVLDDLDIRASDLLQANGVVWVEGPSDRIYINRLIDLLSNGKYRDGVHYMCMFYGGRLLSRVTADPHNNGAINLLIMNRNCALVMDRDTEPINSTKERMKSEVETSGGYVFITDHKEIECSIPREALIEYHGEASFDNVAELESFAEYLDRNVRNARKPYERDKVHYAIGVTESITLDMINGDALLKGHVSALVDTIAKWNPGL